MPFRLVLRSSGVVPSELHQAAEPPTRFWRPHTSPTHGATPEIDCPYAPSVGFTLSLLKEPVEVVAVLFRALADPRHLQRVLQRAHSRLHQHCHTLHLWKVGFSK
jgi:hypothetical protein